MFAATAPAKQSVSETITVLSSRLGSATLLEDRRAAILGLRSFAKDYPASVASGALRGLIGSLSREGDREDVDTVRVVLETLLMLFSPNADSPEASDEIALWLADEFTQRQENVELLLSLIESPEMHPRLYGLQLLAAVHSARPERTEKCILDDPLGVARLIAALDDGREPVRNEAIVLLTSLTPGSTEIQQIVAFGGAFEKILDIIAYGEGGLSRGSRTVEECLVLLANLVRLNPKNQASFRELGLIPRLAQLLGQAYGGEDDELAQWAQEQRDRNVYAMLAVVRLFLVMRAAGVLQNQIAFWQSGLLKDALDLGFNQEVQLPLRVEALSACADIIKGVETIQQDFAQYEVRSPAPVGPDSGPAELFVIEGLLFVIFGAVTQPFDLRYAACECLKAFFYGNDRARLHFIGRAIEGHTEGDYEPDNVLSVLLQPSPEEQAADPYRSWFAAAVMLHLLYNNSKAKAEVMAVTEGDAESGEEVVTSIQTLAAHTLSWLTDGDPNPDKDRILTGYLMLLLAWLFENMDAVNDFLEEGSNVKSLAQAAIRHTSASPDASDINGGLCSMLLGFIYEFSTKDSPVPRAEIHTVITTVLGKDVYVDKLSKLRSHPLMRDFEVTPQRLPDVYFDPLFVEFFKDNYSRATRAIDREPGLEISVASGVQRGISRELVDRLRAELEEKERQLADKARDMQQAMAATEAVKAELAQEKTAVRQREGEIATLKSTAAAQAQRSRAEADTARRQAEIEAEQLRRRADTERAASEARISRLEVDLNQRAQASLDAARRQAEMELERLGRRTDAEKADLRATISRLEVDIMRANQTRAQEVQALKEEHEARLAQQAEQQALAVSREKDAGRRLLDERESALASIIDERESAEKEATERAAALEEEVGRLRRQAEEQMQEVSGRRGEADELRKQAEEHRSRIAELEDELVERKEAAGQVAELEGRLAEAVSRAEADAAGFGKKLEEKESELREKTAELERRLEEKASVESSAVARITELERQLEEKASSESGTLERMAELERKLEEKASSESDALGKITELERRLEEKASVESGSAEKISELERRLGEKESASESDAAKITELERRLAESESASESGAAKIAELERQLAERTPASESGSDARERIVELERQLAEQASSSSDSEAADKIAELERKLAEKTSEAESGSGSADKLAELERKLAEKTSEAESSSAQVAELEKKLSEQSEAAQSEAEGKIAELERQLADKTSEAEAETAARISELEQKLAEKASEAESSSAKMAELERKLAEQSQAAQSEAEGKIGELERKLAERASESESSSAKMAELEQRLADKASESESAAAKAAELERKLADKASESESAAAKAAELERKLAEKTAESESGAADAAKKVSALEEKLSAAEKTASQSSAETTARIAELEKKLSDKTASEAEQLAEMQKKLADAADKHEAVQGDLDAILELNDDLDQKMARYRKRLVDAGLDVSDDEEEEE